MDASPKSVREHIARSKFYLQRKDVLRSLRALSLALGALVGAQIVGRERIEIGILMEEAVRLLMEQDVLKRAVPGGLTYKKGQERELAAQLTRMDISPVFLPALGFLALGFATGDVDQGLCLG